MLAKMVLIQPAMLLVLIGLVAVGVRTAPRPSQLEELVQRQPPPPPQPAQAAAAPAAAEDSKESDEDDDGSSLSDEDEAESEAEPQGCCEAGWKLYAGHCYTGVNNPPLPFYNVSRECKQFDAHFASIHSRAEYAFVKSKFDLNYYWIGVISFQDGHHENQDGTVNTFDEFDDPIWDASEAHPYICEKKAGPCPAAAAAAGSSKK